MSTDRDGRPCRKPRHVIITLSPLQEVNRVLRLLMIYGISEMVFLFRRLLVPVHQSTAFDRDYPEKVDMDKTMNSMFCDPAAILSLTTLANVS